MKKWKFLKKNHLQNQKSNIFIILIILSNLFRTPPKTQSRKRGRAASRDGNKSESEESTENSTASKVFIFSFTIITHLF